MATNLQYNGVLLRNVRTLQFDQVERRDDSGTDAIYWEFTLAVESLCSPQILLSQNPTLGATGIVGDTAAQIVSALEATLNIDRRTLIYTMDNGIAAGQPGATTTTLLHVGANSKAILLGNDRPDPVGALHYDVDNGPKVEHLRVIHISPTTIRIEFSLKVCLPVAQGLVSPSESRLNKVISNRWSATEDYDELWRITRSWRGKIRVKFASASPHDFHNIVMPPLAKGFRRERVHLNAPPNSLELEYEVVDRQMIGDAPPFPGLRMSGTHTESMEWDIVKNRGDFVLRLDGPKGADKRAMMELGFQIAVARLQCQKENFKKTIVQNLTVTDYISDDTNAIEVRATVIHRMPTSKKPSGDGKDPKGFSGIFTETLGKPLLAIADQIHPDNQDDPRYSGKYTDQMPSTKLTDPGRLPKSFFCYLQIPFGEHKYLEEEAGPDGGGGGGPPGPQPDPNPPDQPKAFAKPPQPSVASGASGSSGTALTISQRPISDNWPVVPFDKDDLEAPYQFCRIESELDRMHQRIALPIARSGSGGTDASLAAIRLSPPIMYRTIRFSAERMGDWPKLPKDADFTDGNGVKHFILRCTPLAQAPKLTGDGKTHLYAIDVEYRYALQRSLRPGEEDLPTGHLQLEDVSSAVTMKIPKATFVSPETFPGMR